MRTVFKKNDDSLRVIRGGSWNNNARNCRSANRYEYAPITLDNHLGLRLSRNVKEKK